MSLQFPSAMCRSPLLIAALCCWLAAVTVNYGHRTLYPPLLRDELQFIPEKSVLEITCLDNRGLAADLLFIRVLLHAGSLTWKPARFRFNHEWSYKMIDIATELDPRYYSAYLFSGMGLVHTRDDIFRANRLIKKGMKIFPESWELPFWIGLNAYLYLENDSMAGEYLWEAAHKENAPISFLSLLLSAIDKDGKTLERGIWVLKTMIRHEDNPQVKLVYQKRIIRLRNLIDLQKAVEIYKTRFTQYPENLQQLMDKGILVRLPQDPMGRTYAWNRTKKRVECMDPKREAKP